MIFIMVINISDNFNLDEFLKLKFFNKVNRYDI